MRYIILWAAIALATCPALASEIPKYTPPKDQWVEITKPVIGCFSPFLGFITPLDTPELDQALNLKTVYQSKFVECVTMEIGERYLSDKPVSGYTTLVSVVCEHCAPSAYPIYTTEKTGFYKRIANPINGTSF